MGQPSVKDIQFAELDDFFAVNLKGLSLKSKANCNLSCILSSSG